MEFDEVLTRRRMTRRFAADAVPVELINSILASAMRAPSAGFSQGVDLLCLTEPTARADFWNAASDAAWRARQGSSAGLMAAPVVVVPVANPELYEDRYGSHDKAGTLLGGSDVAAWPVPYWMVDTAFSTMLMLLKATDLGLGALFFQLHAPQADVLRALGIPPGRCLIGAVALGYGSGDEPATSPARRPRRSTTDVIHQERW